LPPGDINIESATDTRLETHSREERKSGIFSSGSFGLTIGSQRQSVDTCVFRTNVTTDSD
jgi:filamentous hemagglutinin